MKLFKSVDEKLEAIGFKKIEESEDIVVYERQRPLYVHMLEVCRWGKVENMIFSYQRGVNSDGLNNNIGLTMYEAKLACKKMKQKGW